MAARYRLGSLRRATGGYKARGHFVQRGEPSTPPRPGDCPAMRVIVVGGAGGMGRVAAWDLARSPGVERVTVADLDGEGAARVAAETSRSAATVGGGAEV